VFSNSSRITKTFLFRSLAHLPGRNLYVCLVCLRARRRPARTITSGRAAILRIGDFLAGGNNHSPPQMLTNSAPPRRELNAWIRPGLTIDAHPRLASPSFNFDLRDAQRIFFTNAFGSIARCAIPPNQAKSVSISARCPRVHSQEGKGCSRSLPTVSCCDGTDPTTTSASVAEFHLLSPVPCNRKLREFADRRDVGTPFGHAIQRVLRPQCAQESRLRSAPAETIRNGGFGWFHGYPERISTGLVTCFSTPIDSLLDCVCTFVS